MAATPNSPDPLRCDWVFLCNDPINGWPNFRCSRCSVVLEVRSTDVQPFLDAEPTCGVRAEAVRLQVEALLKIEEQRRAAPITAASPRNGPGDFLHAMIVWWTREDATLTCNCEEHIRQMNEWGPVGCREHLDEITGWLLAEAVTRGWRLAKLRGAGLFVELGVRRAIGKAERAARQIGVDTKQA